MNNEELVLALLHEIHDLKEEIETLRRVNCQVGGEMQELGREVANLRMQMQYMH
jgi:DNA integrity scanning protein DisA with diadenylate cyclase activity